MNFTKHLIAVLLMLSVSKFGYASDGGDFNAILAVLAVVVILFTILFGYLLRRLMPLLKIQIANWVIYSIAFVLSFVLLCALL